MSDYQEIKHPKDWVLDQLQRHNLDYDYKTDSLRNKDSVVEESLAVSLLRLDAREQEVEDIRSYIKDSLNVYKHERAKEYLEDLANSVSFQETNQDLVNVWIKAVCGKESTLDSIVIKHWIWQIKRKLAGLEVEHHLMPILYGKSGAGKSVSVAKLIEPLKTIALQTGMSIFSDQFSRRSLSRNFIVFFDELQGSESININAMKQIITAPIVEWRAMRSERVMSAPQNATFIGCSNEPVCERIKDPTSSRRFWQITCSNQINWETINSIDYILLWRSVNENAQSPLIDHLEEIRRVQEVEIRSKDLVEQWIEEVCQIVSFEDSSLTTSELYDSFREFCLWQNQRSFPQFQKFARDIKRILGMHNQGTLAKKTNRGTTWSIRLRQRNAVSVTSDINDVSDGQLTFDFKAA